MDHKKKQRHLARALTAKLASSPWDSIRHFATSSGIDRLISRETVRRMFDEDNEHGIEPYRVVYVMRYLGFEANEIREMLEKYTTDTELYKVIGGNEGRGEEGALTVPELAMLRVYHKLIDVPGALDNFAAHLQLIMKANGLQDEMARDIAQLAKLPTQEGVRAAKKESQNVKSV